MPHYFSEKQTSRFKLTKLSCFLRGINLLIYTAPGIFSNKGIDKGSFLLIEKCIIKDNHYILDLGCGYGVIGVTLAKCFPSSKFLLTDINERAVKLSKKNILTNKLENAEAKKRNIFDNIDNDEKFDTILLNPPQTAGKQLCFQMIEESLQHLKKGGTLQLVARHNKGGKSLSKKMKEVFNNVKDISKKSGYRVYLSQRNN